MSDTTDAPAYNPDDHLVSITYRPPMEPRDAVVLTEENWDDLERLVDPQTPILVRPDFSPAEVGDYVMRVPDIRQMDQVVWVVLPASWVTLHVEAG